MTSSLFGGGLLTLGIAAQVGEALLPPLTIGGAAGLGSGLLASGAVLGAATLGRRGGLQVNPVLLHDPRAIVPARSETQASMPRRRLLMVLAPQSEAVERYRVSFGQSPPGSHRQPNPAGVHRENPYYERRRERGPAYHVVAAHGMAGHVMVSTGAHGNTMMPMAIEEFAAYVAEVLRTNDLYRLGRHGGPSNAPIKFISCYGGSLGFPSNAQVLADITGRTVIAFAGQKSESYGGPWKTFRPRHAP
ncbi:hypothetical protein [Streptomyces sp. NPDC053367]|uniref:hypothetical protein n=1 Tax=Streptomyces sp. NPDC053367 TaxID=3365700 RepID=UPI0037D2AA9F